MAEDELNPGLGGLGNDGGGGMPNPNELSSMLGVRFPRVAMS